MAQAQRKKADRKQIYQYPVDIILGQGGTGTVYRAQDPETKDLLAIKVFRANFFRNALHERSIAKMARKAAKLSHPNVVQLKEFLRGKEGNVLVMEYVDGPDLKWYMENRPFNLEARLVIVAQICNGLGYLHENGMVHHDLKPANVLFTRRGQVKLADFSLFGGGSLRGFFEPGYSEQITPMFVSPELIEKRKATHLADMYSLGVVLYMMFTEKVPFQVDTLAQLYHAHLHTIPTHPSVHNPKVPQALGDIIMRLLSKKPELRPQSAEQLRITLAEFGRSRI